MADDAGALLVRSGLVPSSALDDARIRVASNGGTIGEQLVVSGAIADDALTDFYRSRLLVPQVNPNTLARLPVRVVAAIPSDMAIELRAIPVSLDNDNNLTVAMSDPSDSHAVDEIAFFTGAYVVRAVATQMQIAWCLAHYYGHITALGQKLLQPSSEPGVPAMAPATAPASSGPLPRAKGMTAKVEATRHRAIAPITGPVDVPRPRSGELDLGGLSSKAANDGEPAARPELAVPDKRAHSVSGEIRVPVRRAPSIKPPMPPALEDDDDDAPVIEMEADAADEVPTGRAKAAPPRRRQKSNPPELAARAGEVDLRTGPVQRVDVDEPRIIVEDVPPAPDVSGELPIRAHRDEPIPTTTIEVSDDTSVGVVIHEHLTRDSEPVLLDRPRPPTPANLRKPAVTVDNEASDVVVLESKKSRQPRPEKRTQVGIGALPAVTRTHRDTEASGVPALVDDGPTTAERAAGDVNDTDATRIDAHAVPSSPDDFTDETIPPPSPASLKVGDDTSPTVLPPSLVAKRPSAPSVRATPATGTPRATSESDDDDGSPLTSVMSAVELDELIPERQADMVPAHLDQRQPADTSRRIDYDPLDDGWGPPGTTIPPPLLGAIPGSDDGRVTASQIPVPDVESAPLIVAPPSPPEPARGTPAMDGSGPNLVRALEEATSRSIELIHSLDQAHTRDDVISLMARHLAETHRRAGFFSIKSGDLGVFSMLPKPELIPVTTLRLDRPSTLQDVVGTRLPYRGPMHDDASRNFLAAVLGACPPEILLVPVAVRERVVGVLYGEHRLRHTFDDQLALAARAAGMALERILKAKRG